MSTEDKADNYIEPSGALVGIDLSDDDGEGTVCTESEAKWYDGQGRMITPEHTGDSLTLDDVYGDNASL